MAKSYRFKIGDKVQIKAKPSSSCGAQEHNGEIVTIKALCPFLYAYEIEEYPDGYWEDGLFTEVPA